MDSLAVALAVPGTVTAGIEQELVVAVAGLVRYFHGHCRLPLLI